MWPPDSPLAASALFAAVALLLSCSFACAKCGGYYGCGQQLLLLLIDGFRWDYPDWNGGHDLPGFRRMTENGVRAPYVTPIFPSNSYPNWYSLVTGLYGESHGFVQNMMYDPFYGDFFLMAPNDTAAVPHWWDGAEPLWVSAEKRGLRTALYWWDGCEVEIRGIKATYCRKYKYVGNSWSTVNEDIREALLTALGQLANNEIQLAQIYYEPVDFYGHKYGPDSEERKQAVNVVDGLLDLVQREIGRRRLYDQVNFVVVSDHGMTSTHSRGITVINLQELVDVADIKYMVYYGASSMILPHEGKLDKIYAALRYIPGLQIYKKKEIPEHYHLKNNRLMLPLLLVASKNYYIKGLDLPGKSIPTGSSISLGAHGYDPYEVPDMRGIFFARGPGLRRNYISPPLQIVDIYNILCDLLRIPALPNNGSRSVTKGIVVDRRHSSQQRLQQWSLKCYILIFVLFQIIFPLFNLAVR